MNSEKGKGIADQAQQEVIGKLQSAIETYEKKYKQLVLAERSIGRVMTELSKVVPYGRFYDVLDEVKGDRDIDLHTIMMAYEFYPPGTEYRPIFCLPDPEDFDLDSD
ncbi:MAG: hypothetical protein F4X69_15945 [Gemmatimonadetes bacterium]|nr:hypothetical protein [Gemmatimonadota bacterium]